jgi:capsular polysaccharide biosynthesis protein
VVNQAESNHDNGWAKLGTLSAEDVRERLWAYEDFTPPEGQQPFNVAGSFASLGFIGAAIRRNRRFWLAWAAIGLVAGLAIFAKYPVSYTATATVLIKTNPGEDVVSAMQTELQLVESESVAANTVKALGLTQSVSSFQAAYSATVVTNQVISITLSAPTATGAVDRTNALAAQYLKFRSSMLLAQQAQDVAAYAQQVPAAQQQIASLQTKISQFHGSAAKLTKLKNQLNTATIMLPTIEQTVTGLTAQEESTTSSIIDGSQVLNAATLAHHSKIKDIIEYVLAGLIGGLAIGLGIVILRELISDRLRRRDDIAAALGAPVRLSVGAVRKSRLPFGGTSAGNRNRALGRVATYLRNAALRQAREPATIAVVAVDNVREIAPAVVTFAKWCAREGIKVVVTDLVKGAPVARLLGAGGTGVQPVRIDGGPIVVITPEEPDQVPSGPLRPAGAAGAGLLTDPPTEAVDSVAKKARILLTVAELDPAIGGEYLSTWATEAVAVFSAGRTRAARAYAVGEMLRLSEIRAISGIVVGADKTDESVGAAPDDAVVLAGLRSPEPAMPVSVTGVSAMGVSANGISVNGASVNGASVNEDEPTPDDDDDEPGASFQ